MNSLARLRIKSALSRLDPRPTLLFFDHWYPWVETPLVRKCWQLLRFRYRIREISRELVESLTDQSAVESFRRSLAGSDWRAAACGGLRLWEICKYSICDALLKPTVETPEDAETAKSIYASACGLVTAFERLYQGFRPHAIVVTQGMQYDMRVAVELARRRGIRTVAIENSFLRDYFFIDDVSGAIANRHRLSRNSWDLIRARALTAGQRTEVRRFLDRNATTFKHPEAEQPAALRARLGIAPGRKIALLLCQVAIDAALIMDCPLYADQIDFIQDVVGILGQYSGTHQLVIRLHPKEESGTSHTHNRPFDNMTLKRLREAGIDRYGHVTIVHSDQANTYQLMDMADFGITLTSQAGLEMLALYKPMVVAGDAFYARKGFTIDVMQRDQLPGAIGRAVTEPRLTRGQEGDIDNFLYHVCFEYLLPKHLEGVDDRLRSYFE